MQQHQSGREEKLLITELPTLRIFLKLIPVRCKILRKLGRPAASVLVRLRVHTNAMSCQEQSPFGARGQLIV